MFGGPAWFFQAKEILLNNDCVDAVVVGEGELTFDELIRSVEKTGKINIIPGLMTKKNEKLCYGGERPQVKNLDNLPFPFFSGLPIKEYKVYETASSRGCPFNCSFCNTKIFGHVSGTDRQKISFRKSKLSIRSIKFHLFTSWTVSSMVM